MVTEDPVDLNLTMSPSSPKIPALLTKNSTQPCQTESYGEIMWIRVCPIDDYDDDFESVAIFGLYKFYRRLLRLQVEHLLA